jgi:polyhydroxybutyrate depolymerase
MRAADASGLHRTKIYLIGLLFGSLFPFFLLKAIQGCFAQENIIPSKHPGPVNHTVYLTVGQLKRSYIVHVPKSYNERKDIPVVIMFHGGGGSARSAMRQTKWAKKGEEEGFLAVFPNGTRADPSSPARFSINPQSWNDGSNRMNVGAVRRKAADVDFVCEMIDDLCVRFKVDKRRIYATGFSNGASMAFRVGRELSHTLAAIAPVAGNDWSERETIDRSISVLYITGTADPLNPIDGGQIHIGSRRYGNKPPIQALIRKWVRLLGCPSKSRIVYDTDDVNGIAYGPCNNDSEVVFYTINGMGHTWPGGENLLPQGLVGKSSDSIVATDVIWQFFQNHSKK